MLMLIGILFLIFNVIWWQIYTDEDLKSFHIWLGGGWVVGKANLSALSLDLNLGLNCLNCSKFKSSFLKIDITLSTYIREGGE